MDVIILTCISDFVFQRAIGAYQIAHYLRKNNFSVQVVDFTDYFSNEELVQVINKFVTKSTLAFGISTTFYRQDSKHFVNNNDDKFALKSLPENINFAIGYLKKNFPHIKIVMGGSKANDSFLGVADKVIKGYGEIEFLSYLKTLKQKNSIKNFYKPNEVFNIETLDHKFMLQDCILDNETLPIEISRGCIFKCKFCAFPLNGKSKFDYLRDPYLLKEELIYNYENFKTTNYYFCDDTFNDTTLKLEKIHKVITELDFKINFTTYLRLDLLYAHKEQIKLLYEMGLASGFFGIESLNQKSASAVGKGMNVEKTKEFLLDLYYNYWNSNIPITCSFIVGLPYETYDTIKETYDWIKETPLNSMFFPLAITNKSYFKSEFDRNYSEYGYILDMDSEKWTNDHFTFDGALELAEQFNTELMRKNDYPSSWFLMTLLSHGYTLNEAKSTQVKDINLKRLLKAKLNNIRNYKSKLMLLLNDDRKTPDN